MENKTEQENQKKTRSISKTYNLKNDVIFKTFFSRKGNEIFLIDFLEALLKINIKQIQILEYNDYISDTAIVLNKHRECEILTGIKWYFIELPKFRRQHPNMDEKINQWLAFLDDQNKEAVKMAEEKNATLKKARIEMNYLTGDAEVRRIAELREKWEMDYISGMNYAKKEGIKEGEKKNKIQIAQKMIQKGIEIDTIIEITGLTRQEIEKIMKE